MKRQIFLEKKMDGTLYPVDAESAECWTDIKPGKYLFSYVARKEVKRNIYFHRKFFKMLNTVWNNQNRFPSVESLRKAVLVEAGYYEPVYYFNKGTEEVRVQKEASSIAFNKMEQSEFEKCYSDCVNVCIEAFGYDENMFNLLMSFI